MKEKKHIDELFKGGFENFETTPPPRVWENISAQLRKGAEDRKVVPLWVKLGGVAALLALLFTIGNSVFNSPTLENPSVTNEEIEFPVDKNPEILQNEIEQQTEITSEDVKTHSAENENKGESNSSEQDFSTKKTADKTNGSKNALAVENETVPSSNNTNGTVQNKKVSEKITEKEAVAVQKEKVNFSEKEKSETIGETKIVESNSTENIAANKAKTNNIDPIVEEIPAPTKTEGPEKKTSIFDAIAEQNTDDPIVKNPKPENRWSLAPVVAPVYYNSLGNGSSLDPSFADNEKSGEVNMSYGVQISYALNDRLSIRSGLGNVDLSYATGNIELGTGPVSQALRTVNYNSGGNVVTAVDKGSLQTQAPPGNGLDNIRLKSTQGNTEILQSINYYEIPLELKYAVINEKFKVNLIGGLSTLLLGNNEVSVKAANFHSVLGEANNLSSVSFTTNIGLGLDYEISKRFLFNLEPMFKYQLNPYTDSSNFKPYYLGVYTGFSFKF